LILVDTNILLDIVTDYPNWMEWSEQQLENAKLAGSVAINAVICSEL
jgi:predicted nucleic acid-binding protein